MIKNVILDFGHGGIDNNGHYTTSPNKMHTFSNGEVAYEGKLNREIGGNVYTLLRCEQGLNTICTVKKDDPRDLSLSYRVKVANQYPPQESIFVSIHCNASLNHNASGFEIYTTETITKSDKLAEEIANSVESLYKKNNIPLRYDLSDGDKDKEVDFYVLRKTKSPAVLLECGFFDFEKDFKLLSDPIFQSELAIRIYNGIINFINS